MPPDTLTNVALVAITAIAFLLGTFLVPWLKTKLATLTPERLSLLFQLADLTFGALEELSKKSATPIDDKSVEALKQLEELLRANGKPTLKVGEVQLVKARYDALHAASTAVVTVSPLPPQ